MQEQPTKSKATVFWKIGRTEEFIYDLNKGGEFKKAFTKLVEDHRKFPTVEGVQVTKY